MRRTKVSTTLNAAELRAFRDVQRYVLAMSGYKSRAEALRYLVRNYDGARVAALEARISDFLRVYNGADGGDTDEAINDAIDALAEVLTPGR